MLKRLSIVVVTAVGLGLLLWWQMWATENGALLIFLLSPCMIVLEAFAIFAVGMTLIGLVMWIVHGEEDSSQ
jgi:hypothetical protein